MLITLFVKFIGCICYGCATSLGEYIFTVDNYVHFHLNKVTVFIDARLLTHLVKCRP